MTTAVRTAVTSYAEAVVSGAVVTGRLVRLAAERHLRDLEHGHERGLRFDDNAAQVAIDFFLLLRLPDGAGAGQPFVLQPWQEFIVGSIFGWMRADGRRRFSYALVEVARANGKSPLAAGIGLYGLLADGEAGAQVYSAATTRDQAKIVFNDAVHMVEPVPALWKQLLKTVNNLAHVKQGSYFRPLAAEASKMDGLRVHIALVDELHEHPDGDVMAKLRTGMKSSQPLLFAITTAGYDRNSVCWHEHEFAIKVLEGTLDNDSYFAYIATLDEEDAWDDEDAWPKANPSLGITVRIETLREESAKAKQIAAEENDFKRLRLDMWTQQASRWLNAELWEEGAVEPSTDLARRQAYAGVHATNDMAAIVLWVPDDEGGGDVLPFFFLPEEKASELQQQENAPYVTWGDAGVIEMTSGNVTDWDLLVKRLTELNETYDIREVAIHSYNRSNLETHLQDAGFTVAAITSGFAHMSAPTLELERLLTAQKLRHAGNPVLRWMAGNIAVRTDSEGHKRPDDVASGGRIGGMRALIMAIGRAMVYVAEPETELQIFFGEEA
jgi:phage terminase large subunit-like protein